MLSLWQNYFIVLIIDFIGAIKRAAGRLMAPSHMAFFNWLVKFKCAPPHAQPHHWTTI